MWTWFPDQQELDSEARLPENSAGLESRAITFVERLAHSSRWFWTLGNITPVCQGCWITAYTKLSRRACQPTAQESKIQLLLVALTCSSCLVQNQLSELLQTLETIPSSAPLQRWWYTNFKKTEDGEGDIHMKYTSTFGSCSYLLVYKISCCLHLLLIEFWGNKLKSWYEFIQCSHPD